MIPFVFVTEQMEENDVFTITESIISCTLIGLFLLSVTGQTHKILIYARHGHLPNQCQTLMFFFSLVS